MGIEQANHAQDSSETNGRGAKATTARAAAGSLSRGDVDRLVYQCRQAGDDSTYALASAIEQMLVSRAAASASGQPAAQPTETVTLLQLSAPKQIYLDIGESLALATPPRFDLLEGVTWSEDNATSHGIPYVRADLAAAAPADDAEQEKDDDASTLRSLLQEVSACYTRDDDLPNDLLPRIDTALNRTPSAG